MLRRAAMRRSVVAACAATAVSVASVARAEPRRSGGFFGAQSAKHAAQQQHAASLTSRQEPVAGAQVEFAMWEELRLAAESDADVEAAVQHLFKAAENGHVEAQFAAGFMFAEQSGSPGSLSRAAYYFELAANNGHSRAAWIAGSFFADGHGVEKDGAKARKYYELASKGGECEAHFRLAAMHIYGENGLEKSVAKAAELYAEAIMGNHVQSMVNLGVLHASGALAVLPQSFWRDGVRPDPAVEAVRLWEAAAKRGSAEGAFNAGIAYSEGELTAGKSLALAEQFLQQAKDGTPPHPKAEAALAKVVAESLAVSAAISAQQEAAERAEHDAREAEELEAEAQRRVAKQIAKQQASLLPRMMPDLGGFAAVFNGRGFNLVFQMASAGAMGMAIGVFSTAMHTRKLTPAAWARGRFMAVIFGCGVGARTLMV